MVQGDGELNEYRASSDSGRGAARQRMTPYDDLNTVLRLLVTRVQEALGSTFIGAYLQGSFAVGDFDEHSDVDFVVVMSEELSDSPADRQAFARTLDFLRLVLAEAERA